MKYLKQVLIIFLFTYLGELLNELLPLPIPSGVYGLFLLFAALVFKVIPLDAVEESAKFFLEIMPIMFIPASVGMMVSYSLIQDVFWSIMLVTVISTITVMVVTGKVSQLILRIQGGKS